MQQSGFKMNNILKKLGAYCTFLIQDSTTPSDTFYQESTTEYKEVKYWAVVLPARAYDLHSNVFGRLDRTGVEQFGIINIFINIQDGDTIVLNRDYYVDNVGKYQIVGKEIFGTSYYLFEAHLESAL
jgi:hypothetical protein